MNMPVLMSVALGGAVGALARHWVYNAVLAAGITRLPLATLLVNVLGSLCIGVCYMLIVEKAYLPPLLKPLLMTGFLGAFTTFSTFSLDTLVLLERGAWWLALGNILGNVLLCLLATWTGMGLVRYFFQ